ncbi:MAG: hypothetical protein ACLFVU_08070 [Phycisphaerae bacterium]
MSHRLLPLALLTALAVSPLVYAAPEITTATFLGTDGDDVIEGVHIASDGTIYITGTTGKPMDKLPGGVKPVTLGKPFKQKSNYGCGFVARLSADGRKLLSYTQLAAGIAQPTSVAVSKDGVYLAGYANGGLEPLIAGHEPIIAKAQSRQYDLQTYSTTEHHSEPHIDRANFGRGVPFVLRLDESMRTIEQGTFLEGWQSVWHVPHPLREDRRQPVGLVVMSDGDVVVSHDGGYNRFPDKGEKTGFTHFYGMPDHLSRLAPDLSTRRWKKDIYTPITDPEKVEKYAAKGSRYWRREKIDWPHKHLGNTRILRLRKDSKDNLLIAGWSPTRTSNEPWWSPFLWKLSPEGKLIWRALNPDPMGGAGDRMGGVVSDTAVRSVNVDGEDNVLYAAIADGGNSPMRYDIPTSKKQLSKDVLRGSVWAFRGRLLFWGTVARIDGKTRKMQAGNSIAGLTHDGRPRTQAAWAMDIGPWTDGQVLTIGRHTRGFKFTENAWAKSDWGSFVRVYGKGFPLEFSTSVPDADLRVMDVRDGRAVIVGKAKSSEAPTRNPLQKSPAGKWDGYLLVVRAK